MELDVTAKKFNRKILIVDDNEAIHLDIIRSLAMPHQKSELETKFTNLLGGNEKTAESVEQKAYEIESAYNGEQAIQKFQEAGKAGLPFAVVILDMRMPPGMDGLEIAQILWENDSRVEIVICTAFSDYSWDEVSGKLSRGDQFLIIKKPFDISEIKQAVNALSIKWNLSIEKEEAIKIAHESRMAAEAGQSAKKDFLSIMSHEFRTPMNAIQGAFSYISESEDLSSDSQELIKVAVESSNGLLQILDDILDYVQMEKGKLEINEEEFSPTQLIRQVSQYYKNICLNKKIVFKITDHSIHKSMILLGDARRIRQVMNHVINNAISFTSDGAVSITIGYDRFFKIIVKDTGLGICPKDLESIFEAFKQSQNPRLTHKQGIGLGLTICHSIIRSMGGNINIESKLEEGTTIEINIPLKEHAPIKITK